MTEIRPTARTDQQLLNSLARQHRPALLRYFQRKGFSPPEDEDAVQEVFIRLAGRKGFATDVERTDGYLFVTAGHVATDLHRKKTIRRINKEEPYDEQSHALTDHDPAAILEGRDALRLVVMSLKELPERTRTIFILARLEHMRQADIARRLGVSLNTVEKDLRKAICYLAERLGRSR